MTDFDPKAFNANLIDEFRTNHGQVSGMFEGWPLLLLTTTGAKSGKPFTTPVVYTRDGDALVVIASKGGAPQNPQWYRNLVANASVTVELADEKFDATAEVTEGAERRRLYDAQAELMPPFKEYEQNTTREIPVVRLHRVS
jgi:deazaflavin-dependent oxidoreductase (nitroreductase family)